MRIRQTIQLFLALLLASCTVNGGTIFYVLENEVKQPDTGLGVSGTTLTVHDIVSFSGTYYVAAGKVWSSPAGTLSSLKWTAMTPPQTDSLCVAMAVFGGRLYGGFIDSHGTGLGIYSFGAGGSFGSTPDAITGIPSGDQISRLIPAGGRLLAVTSTPGSDLSTPFTYSLYSSADGSTFTGVVTGLSSHIVEATFDGSSYWAVSGTSLYTGAAGSLSPTSTLGSSDALLSVVYDGTNLWVAAKSSGLYFSSNSGASWSHASADAPAGIAAPYLEVGILPTPGKALAGSDGYGYYIIDFTTPSAPVLTRYVNLSLAFYVSSARRFMVDAVNDVVLAGTSGYGLWAGTLSAASSDPQLIVSGWTRQ
jgi:hypothetical protein